MNKRFTTILIVLLVFALVAVWYFAKPRMTVPSTADAPRVAEPAEHSEDQGGAAADEAPSATSTSTDEASPHNGATSNGAAGSAMPSPPPAPDATDGFPAAHSPETAGKDGATPGLHPPQPEN